jgi:hypothetical protein
MTLQLPQRAATLSGVECGSATGIAEQNLALYIDHGWKVRMDWDSHAPKPCVERFPQGSYVIRRTHHWLDHLYRIYRPDGTKHYCAEPYGLNAGDLEHLVEIGADGWDVRIGQYPLWYPGCTTQIILTAKPKEEATR